jgi:hypothetical protein
VLDERGQACHGSLGVLDARLRLLHLGPSIRHVGGQRRDLEADQQIPRLDRIAFSLGYFENARWLRRHDGPIGARRGRHGAGRDDDAFERRGCDGDHGDGSGGRGRDFFDRRLAAAWRTRQHHDEEGSAPHSSGLPMARSRSASASW